MRKSLFLVLALLMMQILVIDNNAYAQQTTKGENVVNEEEASLQMEDEDESEENEDISTEKSYTVTFIDEMRNTKVEKKVKKGEVVEAEKVSKEKIYTDKDHYSYFCCWTIKEGKKYIEYDFNIPIEGDLVLYANYIHTYVIGEEPNRAAIIEFDSQGAEEVDTQYLSFNDLVKEPKSPVKEKYKFIGWYTEAKGGEKWDFKKDRVGYSLKLYAHWEYVGETDGYGVSPITGWEIRNILMLLLSSYIIAVVSGMKILKSSRT